ncbi:hypothetical protein [Intrasporangium oryzae]|nr:hypothetical protein [Intrasporangium oryzae]
MAGWKVLARNRAALLEDDMATLEHAGVAIPPELKTQAAKLREQHHLDERLPVGRRMSERLGGAEINLTWDDLHRLELALEGLKQPKEVVDDAKRHAKAEFGTDEWKQFLIDLQKDPDAEARKKVGLRTIRTAHAVAEAKHEGERQQERGILEIAAGLVLAGIATVLIQALAFPDERLIPQPAQPTAAAGWAVLCLVMLFGMLGGSFSALISLYVTNKTFTNTFWFDPRPSLTVMKIASGLWTAVIGVIAVGSGVVVGTYTSIASLILLAFLFGYGQQAVTVFMDCKVEALLRENGS